MPGPIEDGFEWLNENVVEPIEDTVSDVSEDVVNVLTTAAETIGRVAGDMLRAMGLDPEQLAQEFQNLTEDALQAFIDFMNAIQTLKDRTINFFSLSNQLQSGIPRLSEAFSNGRMQIAMSLRQIISSIILALTAIGDALRTLSGFVPQLHLEQVVINEQPQLKKWLYL